MSKESFHYLCDQLRGVLEKQTTRNEVEKATGYSVKVNSSTTQMFLNMQL